MQIYRNLKVYLEYLTLSQRIKSVLFIFVSLSAGTSEAITITTLNQSLHSLNSQQDPSSFSNLGLKSVYFFAEKSNLSASIIFGLIFCFFVLLSSGLRLWALNMSAYLPGSIVANLNINIYKRFISQNYDNIKKSSLDHLANLYTKEVVRVGEVFSSIYNLITAVVISVFIMTTLFLIDTYSMLSVLSIFCITYFLAVAKNTPILKSNGIIVTQGNFEQLKIIRESFYAASDFKLYNLNDTYAKNFSANENQLRNSIAHSTFLSIFPKYIIEPIVLISVIASTYLFSANGDFLSALGTIVLGLQKLLPSINVIYSSFSNIKMNQSALQEIKNVNVQYMPERIFSQQNQHYQTLDIENVQSITANNLSLNFANKDLFKDLSLNIEPQKHIAIIGESGNGKSSLLKIIAGLSQSSSTSSSASYSFKNAIKSHQIDLYSNEWRNKIAYMPQNSHLFSRSILYNVALAEKESDIDYEHLRLCLEAVLLTSVIDSLPNKLLTVISNDDNLLSGGQKQRLCIARTLYMRRDIIIFDESTSSLDPNTEHAILDNIFTKFTNLTVLAITHRISSLHLFDKIFQLDNGKLLRVDNEPQ